MKKYLLMLLMLVVTTAAVHAQGYWRLKSQMDNYTMEYSYAIVHYVGRDCDAVYFPADSTLKVIRDYDGLTYFDTTWKAAIENDGKIDSYETNVSYRFIISKDDYYENDFNAQVDFEGYSDDGKIGVNNGGFFSSFYLPVIPTAMKMSNYFTCMYYDKISSKTITKRLSLAGFTKCYNQMK